MSKVHYKTFRKQKWICFALSIIIYFVPFIIVAACMFPFMRKADTGYKAALGIIIAVVNALPFLLGVLKFFFAHFPMLNLFAIGFCVLGGLFTFKIFSDYIDKFLWIELTAAVSSIVSCVFWGLFRKYSRYVESIKANVKSGAFALAAQNNNAEVSE